MRRLLGWLSLALAASCSGLLLDKGNAFPCDFNLPETERDAACPRGYVCGVTGTCRRYQYEGPQFEGAPPVPEFSSGAQSHPLVLKQTLRFAFPHPAHGGAFYLVADGDGGTRHFAMNSPLQLAPAQGPQSLPRAGALHGRSLVYRGPDDQAYSALEGQTPRPVMLNGSVVEGVRHFRSAPLSDGGTVVALVREPRAMELGQNAIGELTEQGAGYMVAPYVVRDPPLSPTVERLHDARFLPAQALTIVGGRATVPVVVSEKYFYSRESNPSEWRALNKDEPLELNPPLTLAHDRSYGVWTVTGNWAGRPRVLSTWQLARSLTQPSMARLWPDCSPCAGGEVVAATPILSTSGPAVEVLCQQSKALSLVQVVGSFAADPSKACQLKSMEAPVELAELEQLDDTVGESVVATGKRGQLWVGPSLGALRPVFLDRVPQAVGIYAAGADGGAPVLPLALAGGQVSVPLSDNGYLSFRLGELSSHPLLEEATPQAPVNEAPGWLVLSSGDLVQLQHWGGAPKLAFGPRLLDPRGEPARGPFQAEAFTDEGGRVVSMVLSASDSVYFWSQPQPGEEQPLVLAPLVPQLTPEPTFPIRSLTLERSPLGSDGKSFLRGYLVTSRNLYQYTLGGTPPRWEAKPIVLSSGEPVEVWMDHPRGGLGRVGYRDGQVFTLPGAFPLVGALDVPDAGIDRVLDYENLGGWPVALAQSGLYVAQWDRLPDGSWDRLHDNRTLKTMRWRRITLADGSEPWRQGGLLRVVRRPPVTVQGQVLTTFVLTVYSNGMVHEVGSVTRQNAAR